MLLLDESPLKTWAGKHHSRKCIFVKTLELLLARDDHLLDREGDGPPCNLQVGFHRSSCGRHSNGPKDAHVLASRTMVPYLPKGLGGCDDIKDLEIGGHPELSGYPVGPT